MAVSFGVVKSWDYKKQKINYKTGFLREKTHNMIFKVKQDAFVKCDLDIWHWPGQITLTLVVKKTPNPKEYACEIWKDYQLSVKSYGQC